MQGARASTDMILIVLPNIPTLPPKVITLLKAMKAVHSTSFYISSDGLSKAVTVTALPSITAL